MRTVPVMWFLPFFLGRLVASLKHIVVFLKGRKRERWLSYVLTCMFVTLVPSLWPCVTPVFFYWVHCKRERCPLCYWFHFFGTLAASLQHSGFIDHSWAGLAGFFLKFFAGADVTVSCFVVNECNCRCHFFANSIWRCMFILYRVLPCSNRC